jgi:hypothetical protein
MSQPDMRLAKVEDDGIVIRLSWAALLSATEWCPQLEVHDEATGSVHKAVVTGLRTWADEVVRELNREGEDGSTAVTDLFDRAFDQACEQGAEGVRIWGEEP